MPPAEKTRHLQLRAALLHPSRRSLLLRAALPPLPTRARVVGDGGGDWLQLLFWLATIPEASLRAALEASPAPRPLPAAHPDLQGAQGAGRPVSCKSPRTIRRPTPAWTPQYSGEKKNPPPPLSLRTVSGQSVARWAPAHGEGWGGPVTSAHHVLLREGSDTRHRPHNRMSTACAMKTNVEKSLKDFLHQNMDCGYLRVLESRK